MIFENDPSRISDWRNGHQILSEEFFLEHISDRVKATFSTQRFTHTDTYVYEQDGKTCWRIQGFFDVNTLVEWQKTKYRNHIASSYLGDCSFSARGLEVNAYITNFKEG